MGQSPETNIMNDGFGICYECEIIEANDTLKNILQLDQEKIIRQVTKTK